MKKRKRTKKPPTSGQQKLRKASWTLARAMMKFPYNRDLCNKHVFCTVCNRGYCLGFDSVDQYCEVCPYYSEMITDGIPWGCQKPVTGHRTCQQCGGSIC